MLFARSVRIMRRRVLFAALPAALLAGRAQAQSLPPGIPLELVGYSSQTLSGTAAQVFADKVAALLPDTFQIKLAEQPPTIPFAAIGKASALASYYAPAFATDEPVFGLSAVPMLAASFDGAEALLRVARPAYTAALARHGQVLLSVEPWRPAALWSTFPLRSAGDLRGARFALEETAYVGQGWAEPFVRLGAKRADYGEAEVVLSGGYSSSVKLAREFACVTEVFFAQQLTFLTANREMLDSLTEAQREALVAIGQATEAELWRCIRPFVRRDQQEVASHGVLVSAAPPAGLLAALHAAAEPDIRRWADAVDGKRGDEGAAILADYRRAIGF
jgi:TRAP-type C4-dicarboxylate transport system substrate-binding protein